MNTKILAALLAATALTSATAFASTVKFTGSLYGGMAGTMAEDPDLDDTNPHTLGGSGSLYIPLSGTQLSFTLDAFAEKSWGANTESEDEDTSNYGVAGHFTFTESSRYQLGAFGSVYNVEMTNSNGDDDRWYGAFGAEGRFFFDRAAFYVQGGYIVGIDDVPTPSDECFNTGDNCPVFPVDDIGFVRFGANYYLEDDLKLNGEIGFFGGSDPLDYSESWDLTRYSVELEKQFAQQFSVFGAYAYSNVDVVGDDEESQDEHALTIGVRIRLGDGATGTLRSHEPTNSLGTPNIGRLIGTSDELMDVFPF